MLKIPRIKRSLQWKVRAGYYLCLAFIVVVTGLNYFNLRILDRKIAFGMIVSELFDTTLEMRRFEKNFFLYNDAGAYEQNLQYTVQAERLIETNRESIKKLATAIEIDLLATDIREYKILMHNYSGAGKGSEESQRLEMQVRDKGRAIVEIMEGVSAAEKTYIQSLVASFKRNLIISVIVIVSVGVLIVQYLSRMVVTPLKRLEENMQSIAEGRYESAEMDSDDAEIVSLRNAFDHIFRELEHRQAKFIVQSQKLVTLGTMASGMAHQINNPLSNISTSTQILIEEIGSTSPEFKIMLLKQIESEVDRARDLVYSLLDFSRKKEFKMSLIPLRELLEETVTLIHSSIPPGVNVSIEVPVDINIYADRHRIEQVFVNIIKNAVDATVGDGTVRISTERCEEPKMICVYISDSGIGISPTCLKRIFDPFFTTKEDGKGSGLGLFVAKEIVEEHGGRLEVESSENEGATFKIKIPEKE